MSATTEHITQRLSTRNSPYTTSRTLSSASHDYLVPTRTVRAFFARVWNTPYGDRHFVRRVRSPWSSFFAGGICTVMKMADAVAAFAA